MADRHPVFGIVRHDQGRSLVWLARQIGYSHQHVKDVACGMQRPSARFRAACARALGVPESMLFHADSDASQREGVPHTGSDSDRAEIVVAASVPAA